MDTKQLIKDAKARFKHNSAKAYLKDKYQSKLLFADQGGLWKATPELISFLSSTTDDVVVILDTYENPIEVDSKQLLNHMTTAYNTAMNLWAAEWNELKNNR